MRDCLTIFSRNLDNFLQKPVKSIRWEISKGIYTEITTTNSKEMSLKISSEIPLEVIPFFFRILPEVAHSFLGIPSVIFHGILPRILQKNSPEINAEVQDQEFNSRKTSRNFSRISSKALHR